MFKRLFDHKGFTIVELLAAVVITAIVLGLAAFTISRYVLQGHNTINKQLDKNLVLSAKSYFSDNKRKVMASDSSVLWYTMLKANNYITNDLIDSDNNSCGKSYVVIDKSSSNYKFTGCVVCDNDGYNNTTGSDVCTENFKDYLDCYWESNDKVTLGVKNTNTFTNTLKCVGKGISYAGDYNKVEDKMFSAGHGIVSIESSNLDTSKSKNELTVNVRYTVKPDTSGVDSDELKFNGGSIEVKKAELLNDDVFFKGIEIDSSGPTCTLKGAYSDSALTNKVSMIKGGGSVYYKLTCSDNALASNSKIVSSGFTTNNLISKIEVVTPENEQVKGNEISAVVKVTAGNTDGALELTYNSNQVFDKYQNGNGSVKSSNGSGPRIDGTGPVCTFTGPSSDKYNVYSKTSMDVNDDDFVFYTLTCVDTNDINEGSFKTSNIKNNGFGRIVFDDISRVTGSAKGYKYVIMAYPGTSMGSANLTFDSSTVTDSVGNAGSKTLTSGSVLLSDRTKTPSCSISTSYASDYYSANLTGTLSDANGLSGYAWSASYASPSSYTSTSGAYRSVNNTVTENGYYWLHVKNIYGYTDSCVTYVNQIKEKDTTPPSCTISMTKTYYDGTFEKWVKDVAYTNNAWTQGDVTVKFSCTDNNGVASQTMYDGSNYLGSTSATLTTSGIHTVSFKATDADGNSYTGTKTIKIDKTPPVLTWYKDWEVCNGTTIRYQCTDSLSGISTVSSIKVNTVKGLGTIIYDSNNKFLGAKLTFKTTGPKDLSASCNNGANDVTYSTTGLDVVDCYTKETCTRSYVSPTYGWQYSRSGGSQGTVKKSTSGEWCASHGYSATYAGCSGVSCTSSRVGDTCRTSSGGKNDGGTRVSCTINECNELTSGYYTSWNCSSSYNVKSCTESNGNTTKVTCTAN